MCLERGAAYLDYEYTLPEINRHSFNRSTKTQLAYFPKRKLDLIKKTKVYIAVYECNSNSSAVHWYVV